ncbi:neuronal PAS domain-containing protein 2-like isoform X2 [Watersipora subatra]|uniref:neuronal PAS domain-containing protein 2-like isoform X2 n=1 Tax=Watersipora subatra TaxID=2589382 RepID=UPI00355C53CD
MNYGKRKLPPTDYQPRSENAEVGSSTETITDDCIKRKFRNLNEKKRRDQFNMLINELSAMVCLDGKRTDKTGVLERTMAYLRNHKESETNKQEHVSYSWKPSFLSQDDFTFLILETMNCVILGLDQLGTIKYLSDNAIGKLGLSQELVTQGRQLQEFIKDDLLVQKLINPPETSAELFSVETLITSDPEKIDACKYKPVRLMNVPESWSESSKTPSTTANPLHNYIVQAQTPSLTGEYMASAEAEFKGIYSLEWKILHLEDKAAAVLGYQPHELLGTSGYNHYHPEDMEHIAAAHKKLLKSGCCSTTPYRMSTRSQGWAWLQSKMYVSYDQWAVKPTHIECHHTVPSQKDIESYKTMKNHPDYLTPTTTPAPSAKRPRLIHPFTTPRKQSFSYANNLPDLAINREREQIFGRQLTKTLPRDLLQRAVPTGIPPLHLTPTQQILHQQLLTKYNVLKANHDRQREELSQLLTQLNLASETPRAASECLSPGTDMEGVRGASAMPREDTSQEKSTLEGTDLECSWPFMS